VLCAGTRLIDLTTGSNSLFQDPGVRFVGVNVAGADAHKLSAAPIVADARLALEALGEALAAEGWSAGEDWRRQVALAKERWASELDADLSPRPGERMSQGQVIRALNEAVTAGDALVVASGTPHVDVHKTWDTGQGARVYMEVGFSCMGHEIPAAMGVRMARPELDEVFALIGDGTYLMGHTELVTAVQEGLGLTVVVIENQGFQSIHALQRGRTGRSFGLEFRRREPGDGGRLTGEVVEVDFAANARSYGCAAFDVHSLDELREAVRKARRESRPAVIVAHVEPRRLTLDSECWWDVGVAQVSSRPETRDAAAASEEGRARQRFHA
jgi:3D-(3,5/4)-trihydroxycyclohexane-1,2-dione acylhydrolase (decyclizing)